MTPEEFSSLKKGSVIYSVRTGKKRKVTSVGDGAVELDGRAMYLVADCDKFCLNEPKIERVKRKRGTGKNKSDTTQTE